MQHNYLGKTPATPGGRVWILEPDIMVRGLVQRVLQRSGIEVATFTSVRSFFSEYRPGLTNCLILECTLPDSDGLSVQRRLSTSGDLLPLVFLTESADVPTAVEAMKGGAADFLLKPVDPEALMGAVGTAMSRFKRYQAFQHSAMVVRRMQDLTTREREVLDLVIAGYSTKQISSKLSRTGKTVEFHRQNIMRKMNATNVADLVRLVTAASHDLNRMNGHTQRIGETRS